MVNCGQITLDNGWIICANSDNIFEVQIISSPQSPDLKFSFNSPKHQLLQLSFITLVPNVKAEIHDDCLGIKDRLKCDNFRHGRLQLGDVHLGHWDPVIAIQCAERTDALFESLNDGQYGIDLKDFWSFFGRCVLVIKWWMVLQRGTCGCFVLINKLFFEVNPPYGQSDFRVNLGPT